ncbi:MAG: penicillin-binding transpeptidase domain-containing protein, partial [Patescibacteria group bacterium]|nr:penicillin-binding transpeptidase domain-containing protein [Patescibacteria group bacterium]
LEEIILAIRLTRAYSKEEILNTYLNETAYGGTIYGVQEASQYFFGVDAKDADLAQSAYLAAIPQAPTHLSPYGDYKDELDARKNLVLRRMLETGSITQEEHDHARSEDVKFKKELSAGIKAPHFVFYVRDYLERKYGVDTVLLGGLHVVTTLDYDLQEKAEATVDKFSPGMQSDFNASNTGIVAIDPKTGQILTMVGSKDYFNDAIDGQVNVTLAHRQPGSSFKPFVYATALQKGYTPSTVVFDLQTQFSTACSPQDVANNAPPCYSPQNYDEVFRGPITLRDALAQSINVAAVKVLYLSGISTSIKTAEALGITTLAGADRYGLTLVLGGGEVTLLDMTGAYSVFANDGIRNPPTGILEVTDKSGKTLEKYEAAPTRVMDAQIARQISDILSDDVARAPDFGVHGPLYFRGYDVADKTGTTNDSRDAWIMGYSPSIAVGAWAGNNDNSPMVKKIAAFIVTPMWHDFMEAALEKYSSPSDTFPEPAPDASSSLPPVLSGNWNSDPAQGVHSILYWVNKDNPHAPRAAGPSGDSQYTYWEYPVALWAAQNATGTSPVPVPGIPVPQGQQTESGFIISSPQNGSSVPFGVPISLTVAQTSVVPISLVSYYFNNQLIGTSGQAPYAIMFSPSARGVVSVRAVATRLDGSATENTVSFAVQ